MKICSGGIGTIFERIFSAYQSAHMADIFGNIFFFYKIFVKTNFGRIIRTSKTFFMQGTISFDDIS